MNKNNQILLGVLIVQALFLVGMRLTADEDLAVQTTVLFPDLDPDKVTKLSIAGPPGDKQESISLARKGNSWSVATAEGYPAKGSQVDELLANLAKLRATSTVLKSSRYHEKLEVSESKYQRRVELDVDGQPLVFFVGTSPSFKNTHVRLADSDTVYLVPELSSSDVAERPWNWVERSYVEIPENELWALTITNGNGTITLEKDAASGDWAAVGVEGELDDTTIDSLVNKARSMKLEAPVGKEMKSEYGLATPLATVDLVVGTSTISGTPPPTTEKRRIVVGKKVDTETRYYVKSDTSEYVVTAASYAVEPLIEKGPDDLLNTDEEE